MPKARRFRRSSGSNKSGGKGVSRGVLEKDLLKDCKKILNIFKRQGLLTYRRIHVMPVMRGGGFSINSDMAGLEDLQIYISGGRFWAVELKKPKGQKSAMGKQSQAQKEREAELKNLGFDYSVLHSVDELVQGLRVRGLTLWSFPL